MPARLPLARMRRALVVTALLALVAFSTVGALLFFQPRWLLARFPSSGDVLYFVETDAPVVALTVDDGPDPTTTLAILAELAAHGSRATFFLISGRVAGNEMLLRRMVAEGHELGNHLAEDRPSVGLAPHELEASLLQADRVLTRFAPVRWLRPAGGWYRATQLAIAARHGYGVALGSVYPYDPVIPWVGFAAFHILANARPGSVIILHDGGDRGRRTAAVLRRVLPELARRGLRVVTVSQLVAVGRRAGP